MKSQLTRKGISMNMKRQNAFFIELLKIIAVFGVQKNLFQKITRFRIIYEKFMMNHTSGSKR